MEISQNELVHALDLAQNIGPSTPEKLAGFVFGYVGAIREFAESGGAVADAPEDPTPQVGDRVRVVANPIGYDNDPDFHTYCEGETGILYLDSDGDHCAGGHAGPLSDFEKV